MDALSINEITNKPNAKQPEPFKHQTDQISSQCITDGAQNNATYYDNGQLQTTTSNAPQLVTLNIDHSSKNKMITTDNEIEFQFENNNDDHANDDQNLANIKTYQTVTINGQNGAASGQHPCQIAPTTLDDALSIGTLSSQSTALTNPFADVDRTNNATFQPHAGQRNSIASRDGRHRKSKTVIRKFQKLDSSLLHSTPAPDVKIGQRVAYKEYYGNEFGTIRWIGRVPQICPDWTAGIEFDNAIGEGDGSLNGRRYFIAKDCFAKFLPLNSVAFVDQHVGRPEPGTMISVMSAAVRPGQMISIQRVSTVHVQHCFLNAPHHRPLGAEILAVNTRLHCQCPNCGPCAHVIKPPRTQRLARAGKNATHMCQFSTYTCCGMESQEEALCTYTGNKVSSLPPPKASHGLPSIGNSWMEGSGYLSQLQAQQSKLMPEEYRIGAAPEDIEDTSARRRLSRSSSKRSTGRRNRKHNQSNGIRSASPGVYNPTSLQPQTENTHFSEQAASYRDESNYNSVYQYSSAVAAAPESATNDLAVACQDKTFEDARLDENNKVPPSGGRFVYRDSIENRYLFPTDDPIDSTLEADLENLSQARYGHRLSSRLNSSRNIFKSLRSLVSCLGAQSNHSELERHSENTFRFSEQVTKNENKSLPEMTPSYAHECCVQSISQTEKHEFYDLNDPPTENDQTIKNDQMSRRQMSSSSDCGFSSASQNSMNFQSFTGCSSTKSADDEKRTNQIYNRIITRLMSTTELSSEDLIKLKRVLFDHHPDEKSYSRNISTVNYFEADRIIAEIIRKSHIKSVGKNQSLIASCQEKCCMNNTLRSNSCQEDTSKRSEGLNCSQACCYNDSQTKSQDPSSNTFNSDDSLGSTATIDDNHQSGELCNAKLESHDEKSVNIARLQRAFELKLTLSINSDNNSSTAANISKETDRQPDSSNSVNNKLLNSTLNINIAAPPENHITEKVEDILDNEIPAT